MIQIKRGDLNIFHLKIVRVAIGLSYYGKGSTYEQEPKISTSYRNKSIITLRLYNY